MRAGEDGAGARGEVRVGVVDGVVGVGRERGAVGVGGREADAVEEVEDLVEVVLFDLSETRMRGGAGVSRVEGRTKIKSLWCEDW